MFLESFAEELTKLAQKEWRGEAASTWKRPYADPGTASRPTKPKAPKPANTSKPAKPSFKQRASNFFKGTAKSISKPGGPAVKAGRVLDKPWSPNPLGWLAGSKPPGPTPFQYKVNRKMRGINIKKRLASGEMTSEQAARATGQNQPYRKPNQGSAPKPTSSKPTWKQKTLDKARQLMPKPKPKPNPNPGAVITPLKPEPKKRRRRKVAKKTIKKPTPGVDAPMPPYTAASQKAQEVAKPKLKHTPYVQREQSKTFKGYNTRSQMRQRATGTLGPDAFR